MRSRFQSTLPVWGATGSRIFSAPAMSDFNPRSPCGERRSVGGCNDPQQADFNPRSPCGERLSTGGFTLQTTKFQSTLPVWGATFFRR